MWEKQWHNYRYSWTNRKIWIFLPKIIVVYLQKKKKVGLTLSDHFPLARFYRKKKEKLNPSPPKKKPKNPRGTVPSDKYLVMMSFHVPYISLWGLGASPRIKFPPEGDFCCISMSPTPQIIQSSWDTFSFYCCWSSTAEVWLLVNVAAHVRFS